MAPRITELTVRNAIGLSDGPRLDPAHGPGLPLDTEFLVRQTFGDPVLEAELLRLFDAQAAEAIDRLATPGSAQEGPRRADLAHRIKGAARAIGAVATATAAEDYEEALRAGSLAVDACRERLVAALTATRIALAARVLSIGEQRGASGDASS